MFKLGIFLLVAIQDRCAYIDMDGCLLHRMPVPAGEFDALTYWKENLCVTRIVWHRLLVLYLLKLWRVKLYIWTNRSEQHRAVTHQALGRHLRLFTGEIYAGGNKHELERCGPCMDDQAKYIGQNIGDLLVRQL